MIQDLESFRLGQTAEDLVLSDSGECREVSLALARQAARSLEIFSHDLDATLYDNEPFLDAIKTLATDSRHSQVRILTQDTEKPVKHGHRIIELTRRLTSSIEIRQVHKDFSDIMEAFLVADVDGILHRKNAARYEAMANFHAPNQARMLLQLFDEVWQKSIVPTELRRLHL